MKIGLLMCDHIRPGFQVIGGDYDDFFRRLLPAHEVDAIDVSIDHLLTSLSSFDAFIISGSRHNVADGLPWIDRLSDLVSQFDQERRPLVGVCFGAQIIAHALGGKVRPSTGGWAVGTKEVTVVGSEWWMVPPVRTFRILHSNAEQVVALPPRGRLLGRSDSVPISMFGVGDHILAVQGHPEFTVEYAAILMEARRGTVIPEEVVEAGLASLEDGADTDLLAGWLSTFIERE